MAGLSLEGGALCYGVRRVNPPQGVLAVVKRPSARALSLDGIHWQIQVLARAPRTLWSRGGEEDEPRYFRFGSWSPTQGLTRVPVNPILDLGAMLAASEDLVAQLPCARSRIPFPLADTLELWLLDQTDRPLALLGTALPGTDRSSLEMGESRWEASARGERAFVSRLLIERGVPERDATGRRPHVEALEDLVARTAGRCARTLWFDTAASTADAKPDATGAVSREREPMSAQALLEPRTEDREAPCLEAESAPRMACRPAFGVRVDWPDEQDRRLFAEYRAWLSPYLLALPDLDETTRRSLEQEAAHHPQLVEALWRLYPAFLDQALLKRIRVEAKIRSV